MAAAGIRRNDRLVLPEPVVGGDERRDLPGQPDGLAPVGFFRARREVLVNLTRIREIRPYFKSGFLLVMADTGATEIVVSERQARSLRQRIPGL